MVGHSGPAGVSSPAFRRRSRSLSGISCSHAVGQPPANSAPRAGLACSMLWRTEREHPACHVAVAVSDPQAGDYASAE